LINVTDDGLVVPASFSAGVTAAIRRIGKVAHEAVIVAAECVAGRPADPDYGKSFASNAMASASPSPRETPVTMAACISLCLAR
jgi:hypothetical protein